MSSTDQATEAAPLGESAYYEVWGGMERTINTLWVALWFAITCAIVMALGWRASATRPPVVIRIDGKGESAVLAGVDRQPPVSEAEIRNFLAVFERFFVELDVHTYAADLRMAYTMMTPEFQAKAADMVKRGGLVEGLKINQTKTELFLTELRVVRDTPQLYECQVKGYRKIQSYKPDAAPGEVVFEHDIVLRKVPRAEQSPYGVLVDDFRESQFKRE